MSEQAGPPVHEASLEPTDAGLVPSGPGWFVVNARDVRWVERPGRGRSAPLTGWTDEEAESWFRELGVNLLRLGPGEPIGMYHWEADAEDFLVLFGDAVLIVEGRERELGQWDFVHCPPGTRHMIAGAGHEGCVVLAVGARRHIGEHCNGGAYVQDEVAARYGASPEDPEDPYAPLAEPEPTRYEDGWLPFGS